MIPFATIRDAYIDRSFCSGVGAIKFATSRRDRVRIERIDGMDILISQVTCLPFLIRFIFCQCTLFCDLTSQPSTICSICGGAVRPHGPQWQCQVAAVHRRPRASSERIVLPNISLILYRCCCLSVFLCGIVLLIAAILWLLHYCDS